MQIVRTVSIPVWWPVTRSKYALSSRVVHTALGTLALGVPVGRRIRAVRLCYRIENPRRAPWTVISQVRLGQVLEDGTVVVRHDDPTDLASTERACYVSTVSLS
jgi:hypothetical protein